MNILQRLFLLSALLCTAHLHAQEARFQRHHPKHKNILSGIPIRNVGPSVMGGRVTDVDVNPNDPTHFFVAYASGGLWETKDGGISFSPLFDDEATITIGDVAVDWNNTKGRSIWLGTGEVNSSRSSYAGLGMFHSSNGGKTWTWKGLPESHHIGRVLIHPTDSSKVMVAVLGHLYSSNPERGIFATQDGGKSWQRSHFVDESTGSVDMVMDEKNPNIVYASFWQRSRKAWNFDGSGPNSGIWKTTDGGKTWAECNKGLPKGNGMGRAGLALHQNGTIYCVVDLPLPNPPKADTKAKPSPTLPALKKEDFRKMSKEEFLNLDKERLAKYLKSNGFPKKATAEFVIKKIKKDELKPQALADYLENANSNLFEGEVTGATLYRSDDGGKNWKKTHDKPLDDLFYTYGYYFAQVRVAPQDVNQVYLLGVPLIASSDGGKTFKAIDDDNVHGDHHALWINPKRQGHLINGNDGGVNISYNNGKSWQYCNSVSAAQCYAVQTDNASPYNVYCGLQDNGVWKGSSLHKEGRGWYSEGEYAFKRLLGGDGMQIQVNPHQNNEVYTGFQFGNYFRINTDKDQRTAIGPEHQLGEHPPRFNWQTPILLSPHTPGVLYMGAEKLYRSFDKGETFEACSPDLTAGPRKGNVPYGTITSIAESPKRFGLLYVGTDDGQVHISMDNGHSWKKIMDSTSHALEAGKQGIHFAKLHAGLWVSRVFPSAHEEGKVYVTLNGYRQDDFTPYLWVSHDYGKTWQHLGRELPLEPINVVREDPEKPGLLYLGTDNGLYISLSGGAIFYPVQGLPHVAVHDLALQARERELVVGTHGRGIYIFSVKELQQLSPEIENAERGFHAFELPKMKHDKNWGNAWNKFREVNEPNLLIPIFAKNAVRVKLSIQTEKGLTVKEQELQLTEGFNYTNCDLSVDASKQEAFLKWLDSEKIELPENTDNEKLYLTAGKYLVKVKTDKGEQTVELTIDN